MKQNNFNSKGLILWKGSIFYLPPECKFGYNVPQDIPVCPARYFNQTLLNFNQYFASDADYIFFARSVYEQDHLRSSINFAMHKTKPGTLSPGTANSNFKGTIKSLVPSDNEFSLISSVKVQAVEYQHTGNSFYMVYK